MSFVIYDYQLHYENEAKEWSKKWPILVLYSTFPCCNEVVRPKNWLGIIKSEKDKTKLKVEQKSVLQFKLFVTEDVSEKLLKEIEKNSKLCLSLVFKTKINDVRKTHILYTNCTKSANSDNIIEFVRIKVNGGKWEPYFCLDLNESLKEKPSLENITWIVCAKDFCTDYTVQELLEPIFEKVLPKLGPNEKPKFRTHSLSPYNIRSKSKLKPKSKPKKTAS